MKAARRIVRRPGARALLALGALACAAPLAGLSPAALASSTGQPLVVTGGVTHVRGSTAELDATVDPHGLPTTYYFQFGPTTTYGFTTAATTLPASNSRIKVGQITSGLQLGYHYRVVAFNAASNGVARVGKDRVFGSKSQKVKFHLPKKLAPVVYKHSVTISGSVTGIGAAGLGLALQASSYPYLSPFRTVGTPATTSASGAFTFHIASVSSGTQFRVITLGARPAISGVLKQEVMPHVVLKVHHSSKAGLVRLYGTITPAENRARVFLQVSKATRPGETEKTEERTSRFVTQFSTVARRAGSTMSFFSIVVKVSHGGRYRAYVPLRGGALKSGGSSTVVLRAAAGKH
jgi:hypothetical protein